MEEPAQSDPARIYEEYLGRTIADPWTRILLEYASLGSGERVLDLACGTGSVARQATPIVGERGKVTGLDINPGMLAVARSLDPPNGAPIEWLQGDALALQLPDSAFDVVLCQQGLQFFADRARALREMRRVLVAVGRTAISVWQSLDHHPLYESLFRATVRHLNAEIADVALSFSLGSAHDLKSLLIEANFRDVQVIPRSHEVRLPSPERFVAFTVLGAATSVPAFAALDEPRRAALIDAIVRDTRAAVKTFRRRDELVFPMSSNIAIGCY